MGGMTLMKAVLVDEPGGPEKMRIGEYPQPPHGEDDLLVRVKATALNRADLLQREGRYPPPPGASPLLGLEIAGVVESRGANCQRWNTGDRVFGLLPGGGYAEYAVIHQDLALPMLPGLSFEQAAAIPEVFLTAYQALFWYGRLDAAHHVLIHAGASGVGTAAIQLVRDAGACAHVTASAPKLAACRELGATTAVDYESEDFVASVLEATEGRGADLVLDFIGGPYFDRNVDVLALDGRLVLLATLGGGRIDSFDLRELFKRRAHVFASTLRNRNLSYKVKLTQEFAAEMMPKFLDGSLKPVIDRVFDWEDVAEAHRHMGENRNVGKIVLRVG
jgi:tumor protein p53-inducible protein 3